MENLEGTPGNSPELPDITLEHSAETYERILYWSFLLSQGNPQIQKQVLDYAISHTEPFKKNIYNEALNLFVDKHFDGKDIQLSKNIRSFHEPIDGESITTTSYDRIYTSHDTSTPLKTLQHQLSFLDRQPTEKAPKPDIRVFANRTWDNDIKYYEKNGRPNRKEEDDGSGKLKDRWFSFGVAYLLRGEKTPVEVINKMLEEARSVSPFADYTHDKFERLRFEDLNNFIEQYNLKHVQRMITSDQITSYFTAVRKDEDLHKETDRI